MAVTALQLQIIKMGLEFEIKTNLRMQVSKEPALRSLKRLTGMEFPRGIKGRQLAIQWIDETLALNGIEEEI